MEIEGRKRYTALEGRGPDIRKVFASAHLCQRGAVGEVRSRHPAHATKVNLCEPVAALEHVAACSHRSESHFGEFVAIGERALAYRGHACTNRHRPQGTTGKSEIAHGDIACGRKYYRCESSDAEHTLRYCGCGIGAKTADFIAGISGDCHTRQVESAQRRHFATYKEQVGSIHCAGQPQLCHRSRLAYKRRQRAGRAVHIKSRGRRGYCRHRQGGNDVFFHIF